VIDCLLAVSGGMIDRLLAVSGGMIDRLLAVSGGMIVRLLFVSCGMIGFDCRHSNVIWDTQIYTSLPYMFRAFTSPSSGVSSAVAYLLPLGSCSA